MALIVPDASVILKWIFKVPEEKAWEKADDLLHQWLAREVEFVLPSLWIFEVCNVIGLKDPKQAPGWIRCLLDYEIPEVPVTHPLASKAVEIMNDYGATFYDAIYHALAIQNGGTYLTADEKYLKKAKCEGHIQRLLDWPE